MKRTPLALVALLLCAWNHVAWPQERIGLVLGGGGARGGAHIGVLKVLERERIPVHAIAGTSVGAIIGGLYAAGYSPDEIETIIAGIDWIDIFNDKTARADLPMRQKETDLGVVANLEVGLANGGLAIPTTLVRGQKLGLLLRRLFLGRADVETFDDLPIPFRCVATDIGVVKPLVFRSGDLALAVRASMAVPGAFAPVKHDGKVLVDGGIVNNVPVNVAREMGVDRLIVVDVGSPLAPADTVDSSIEILLQMVGGMMRDRTDEQIDTLTARDVLLRPEMDVTNMDFPNATQGIAPGERAALAALEQLRTFAVPEADYLAWQSRQHRRYSPPSDIAFVEVETASSATAEFVRDRITAKPGQAFDEAALERDIRSAFGRGTYESISYRLETDEHGNTGVKVVPVDATLGRAVFRVGLQINDDFSGNDDYQLNIESRITNLTDKGAEWRNFLGIGRVAMLSSDFYLPFGERGSWFASPEIGYTALNQPLTIDDVTVAQYRVASWSGGLRIGYDINDRLRLSTAAVRGRDIAKRAIALPIFPEKIRADIGGVNGTVLWDSLNNVRFPTRGLRAELSYTRYLTELDSNENGNLLRAALDTAFTSGRNTLLVGGRASLAKDAVDAYQTESSLGGLTFLSGLGERELLGNQMLLLRSVYYRRLTKQSLLLDMPLYLAASLEGGNVWDNYDEVALDDLIGAGSVFLGIDLPIGPLQFGYGRTFDGDWTLYLTFGSLVLPRYR